jgi:hypothetical protein
MTTIEVDYNCCGAHYELPVRLRDDQSLLRHASLADTMLAYADATHDAEHPECLRAIES